MTMPKFTAPHVPTLVYALAGAIAALVLYHLAHKR